MEPKEKENEKMESEEEENEDMESETEEESEYQPSKYAQSRMIKITVGDTAPYFVHQDLLVKSSDYFQGCLNSTFLENQSGEVQLDMDDKYFEAFGYYVDFMYKGSYDLKRQVEVTAKIPFEEEEKKKLGSLCTSQAFLHTRIYIVAERLCCNDLGALALENLKKTLYIAYEYPTTTPWERFMFVPKNRKEWEKWQAPDLLEDFEGFRAFCKSQESKYGTPVLRSTLICYKDLNKLVQLVFENTAPKSTALESGVIYQNNARDTVIQYYASCIPKAWSRGEFINLLRTQDDVLQHLLLYLRNARPIGVPF